jgi:hypothetical protein
MKDVIKYIFIEIDDAQKVLDAAQYLSPNATGQYTGMIKAFQTALEFMGLPYSYIQARKRGEPTFNVNGKYYRGSWEEQMIQFQKSDFRFFPDWLEKNGYLYKVVQNSESN